MRIRLLAACDVAALVWRVWRLHRRTGIPFTPLFEAHTQALDHYRTILEAEMDLLRAKQAALMGEAMPTHQGEGRSS